MKKPLTIFTWGYWGWGNHTSEFGKAVDAVERSRGFKPPIFVDIRIRREVRAKGFNGDAFGSVVGKSRHRWVQDLGNEEILTGGKGIRIRKPRAAAELLAEAVRFASENRRLIFFCSREPPCWCHRSTVAKLVLKYARKQKIPAQVVEWPGGNPTSIDVFVSEKDLKMLGKAQTSIPLTNATPLARYAGLPWGSVARVHTASTSDLLCILPGPAKCRGADDWSLPVLTEPREKSNGTKSKRKAAIFRSRYGFDSRASP